MKPLYEAIGGLLIERGWVRLKKVPEDAHGEVREWQPPLPHDPALHPTTPAMNLFRAIDYEMDRELGEGQT